MRTRLWSSFLRFYRSRIVQGMFLMIVALGFILLLAVRFAPQTGLDLLRFQLSRDASFTISMSPWIVALMVLWALIAWWFVWPRGQPWEATEINVDVARIAKVVLKPTQETAGIAHRAWAEIMTRKAGLPFDEDHDVIVEVCDSWYSLFGEFRTLVKGVPVDKLRASEDAQKLCDLLVVVLNNVLRPHLTRHQAKFRAWYKVEALKSVGEPPQAIQRRYPGYDDLVKDLKTTNDDFVNFADALWRIARGRNQTDGN